MNRQRLGSSSALLSPEDERLRRDPHQLAAGTAAGARVTAALWLELDVRRMCERGSYVPDFSTPVSLEFAK